MIHSEHTVSLLVILVGFGIIGAILIKSGLRRMRIPGLVGLVAFGILLRTAGWRRLSFGSVAEQVIRDAECHVLVIRREELPGV